MSKKKEREHPPKMRFIPAGEFKAKCLKLLDEVNETGEVLIVTKRGRPVARVMPTDHDPFGLRGSVLYEGDIISPIFGEWDPKIE